jgi:hypothetical protein
MKSTNSNLLYQYTVFSEDFNAFMAADLPNELIELLVIEGSAFADNLQNLLLRSRYFVSLIGLKRSTSMIFGVGLIRHSLVKEAISISLVLITFI